MNYEVKAHGRIGTALQRVAAAELATAMKHLVSFREVDVIHATHEARKHFKKIRALLQLIRDALGKEAFKAENVCYREAGRQFSDLRDAQMLVTTLEAVRERFFGDQHPPLLSHARRLLAAAALRHLDRLTTGRDIPAMLRSLKAAAGRADQWQIADFGWKEARHALERSYRQARRAFRRAEAEPNPARLHDWRKQVKILWYQTRLLRRACPAFMEEYAHDLEVLTEFIGDDHDLAVLCAALAERRELLKQPRALKTLFKLIDLRRRELISAAFDLSARLFPKSSADFARGLHRRRQTRRSLTRRKKKLAPLLTARG